jgi:hypothetical protein
MKDSYHHGFQCIAKISDAGSLAKCLQIPTVRAFTVSLGVAASYKNFFGLSSTELCNGPVSLNYKT